MGRGTREYRVVGEITGKLPRNRVLVFDSDGHVKFVPSKHLCDCIDLYGEDGLRSDDFYSGDFRTCDSGEDFTGVEIKGEELLRAFKEGDLVLVK
jgi:hypothetical protein